jgi:hypothetical protein
MTDFIISTEYDGKKRKLFHCNCQQCNKDVWRPKHHIKKNTCCSRKCYQLFRQKTGKRVDVICIYCNKSFKRFQHHLAKVISKRYFCSRTCQQEASIKHKGNCVNCNIQLIGKARKYCSNTCQNFCEYDKYICDWKAGLLKGYDNSEGMSSWLRRYMIERSNNKCSECGWCKINPTTGKVPLQVDHIDGNYKNNKEDNLRVLCPSCHSLTPTFGSLNKGKGREKRRLKLQNNKIDA